MAGRRTLRVAWNLLGEQEREHALDDGLRLESQRLVELGAADDAVLGFPLIKCDLRFDQAQVVRPG